VRREETAGPGLEQALEPVESEAVGDAPAQIAGERQHCISSVDSALLRLNQGTAQAPHRVRIRAGRRRVLPALVGARS